MHGELAEDGADDVRVEDVVLGTLFGEGFDGLGMLVVLGRWDGVMYLRAGDG